MIKITNNNETKLVTKGAYESFYKPLGFKVITGNTVKANVESVAPKATEEVKEDLEKEVKEDLEEVKETVKINKSNKKK